MYVLTCQTNGRFFRLMMARSSAMVFQVMIEETPGRRSRIVSARRDTGRPMLDWSLFLFFFLFFIFIFVFAFLSLNLCICDAGMYRKKKESRGGYKSITKAEDSFRCSGTSVPATKSKSNSCN